MQTYVDTLAPCVYDNFSERVMTAEHRAVLLPERLKLIEKMVQRRTRKLLEG